MSDSGQGFAYLHGMVKRRIKNAVHELDIPQSRCSDPCHGIGYASGILQAARASLNFGVGAVDALELTACLGLDRDSCHLGAIGRDIQPPKIVRRRAGRRKPRSSRAVLVKDVIFNIGDTGQIAEALIARDAIEEPGEDQFSFSDNGKGIGRQAQNLLRHDPERHPSQYYRGAAPGADGIHDTLQVIQKEHRGLHVNIVDVADREANDIGLKAGHARFDIVHCVPGKHQVQELNGVACTFRGVRDYTGTYGHHRHGKGISVRTDEKNFHWLKISLQH
jgi:hypothetical protein